MSLLKTAFSPVARCGSRLLARSPRLLFSIQEGWLRVGHRLLDLKWAAWAIGRPEWLMQKSRREPIGLEPPHPVVGDSERTMADRIIRSAHRGQSDDAGLIPGGSLWGTIRQANYARLTELVERGEIEPLAHFLSSLFRTETVDGYAYGTWFDSFAHRWAYLPVNIELSVVTLCECLGILRSEQHEQGEIAYWRREFSEQDLIERLEAFFGFRIEQPRAGDPRGIMFGGRFLTRETCTHLYSAHRMREAIERHRVEEPLNIVEIGGGYGGTCYWMRKIFGERIRRYVIVDLPEGALVQSYFLGSVDPLSLSLYGEKRSLEPSSIELLPHFRLQEIDFQPNIVINQDSMPEMPESEVRRYAGWISEQLRGLFFSFNQEAYSPWRGELQTSVPGVLAGYPELSRVSRETSWSRRGYVEEVYDRQSHGGSGRP